MTTQMQRVARMTRLENLLRDVLNLYPETYSCAYGSFEKAHIDPQEWVELRTRIEKEIGDA